MATGNETGSADVVILGSGFSRALSDQMPCVRDLAPDLTRYLTIVAPEVPVEALLGKPPDVEALLGYLAEAQPWLGDSILHRNRAALTETVLWLADHIWNCQAAAMTEPAPQELEALIRIWHRNRTTVITFNYDTLVEAAFVSLREELGLERSDAPARCLSSLDLPTLASRKGYAMLSGEPERTFRLLKLHGSLNWMYAAERGGYGDAICDTLEIGGWGHDERRSFEEIRRLVDEALSE